MDLFVNSTYTRVDLYESMFDKSNGTLLPRPSERASGQILDNKSKVSFELIVQDRRLS
jgi:hypothetical protein